MAGEPLMAHYVLGISAWYHDSAACLLRDGVIVAAAHEERFTRVKHDASFPKHAVDFCLSVCGIQGSDLDCVVFYEKPFLRFERLLETYLAFAPHGLLQFLQAIPLWLRDKLWIKDHLRRELGFKGTILFPEHHQSHAASAFFASPYNDAAFLTLDGVGEWATSSFGVGCGNHIEMHSEIRFPHSLGLLYSAFTYYTGFKVNSGEYKLMGLAPYGEPKYVDTILEHLVDLKEDGSFRLNLDYFGYCTGLTMTNKRFDKLFGGPPRRPEALLTQREMDLACSVQEVTEEIMLRMVRHVRARTGMKHLCLAGGVALNCVANGRILREGSFDEIWIQPASGDAGGALGAALFGWHQYLEQPRSADGANDFMQGAYLGPAFDKDVIRHALEAEGAVYREVADEQLAAEVAELLAAEHIVGWFQGRMEFGPRALGNRSILADPRSPQMQRQVNLKVKFREGFRPFAPIVLEEKAAEWFDLPVPSPYMLLVAQVHPEKLRQLSAEERGRAGLAKLDVTRSTISAVTHVDGSARIQTVSASTNPLLHRLLTAFDAVTGCPVLVNTSFNVRGEPIVCTPAEALRCFLATDIDALAIGPYLLEKTAQPETLRQRYPRGAMALD
jgi:carbamoyltransferase